MTRKFFCVVLLTVSSVSYACLGVMSEEHTFLKSLPTKAMSREVVAQIEIVSVKLVKDGAKIAEAKVVTAKKGTKKDELFNIDYQSNSSSNRDPEIAQGQTYESRSGQYR